jgi:hypothetical protein
MSGHSPRTASHTRADGGQPGRTATRALPGRRIGVVLRSTKVSSSIGLPSHPVPRRKADRLITWTDDRFGRMPRNDVPRPRPRVLSMSPTAAVGARLKRIKELVYGLARANGAATPAAQDLAEEIVRELDVVRRNLRTDRREQSEALNTRSRANVRSRAAQDHEGE